ncbi:MAG: NAD-dependent succinate-semialdehyde dehydrogenase [Bryobacterales bacterium]|nr:NAD-dependent succinate-semialdehyde dehydrogenase [Bryobacterales bacterium]
MEHGYRRLYINGELRDAEGGRRRTVVCPATEEPAGEIAWATQRDALAALESARQAFRSWSKTSIEERSRWMSLLREAVIAREEDLRLAVMNEMGKPWDATAEDYQTVVNSLQWYAEEMRRNRDLVLPDVQGSHRHEVITQPAGVVGAFLAWNFPLLNVGFKLGPALAAGCSIILRPSSSSPLSAYVLGEICAQVNFPPGVINILCGPADEVAETISTSSIPRVLTMIGSSETGRRLIAQSATSVKRLSMELGGNAPVLVFEDADAETAARETAALKFGNCGQICVAPNRIFVHEQVYERFTALFLEHAKAVKVGFGRHSGATMGPLIDARSRERVEGMVASAIDAGAQLSFGGARPPHLSKGYFLEPTVLEAVTPSMRVFREEIFGPVAALLRFREEREVLDLANDTEYGLVAYVHTRDGARARRVAEELEFGEVMVNGFKYAIDLPHGGIKESGIGKDCSHYALEDYLIRKRITTRI